MVPLRLSAPRSLASLQSVALSHDDNAPLQIATPTTPCRLVRAMEGEFLPIVLAVFRNHPASVHRGAFERHDLRPLSIDDLERFVLAAAKANASLSGCGIPEETADDLIRRAELHCKEFPAEAASLKATLHQLRLVKQPRDIQLSSQAQSPIQGLVEVDVGFKQCFTTPPIGHGREFVIATSDLQTCTAVAVVTKDVNGHRIVTLAHIPSNDMYARIQQHVAEHHSPDAFELDHEVIMVTPALKLPEAADKQWGIRNAGIRETFEMEDLLAPSPGIPATSQEFGPRWFDNNKTTLIVYPRDQRNGVGATFTLRLPADADQPVEFFLQLS
jgi:hypothetical protein